MSVVKPGFQQWMPQPRRVSRLEWLDVGQWDGKDPPPREWIIEGIVPHRTVTLLSGDGGVGKSLLAQQMMTACALGQDFLGMAARSCKTLGVFCEDEFSELQRRQRSICLSLGVRESDIDGMMLTSRVGEDNILADFDRRTDEARPSPLYDQILHRAKQHGAQLVIIDTIADVYGGNENIRPQVRAFIQLLARMAREIDGSVLCTAHPSAAGMATGSGYSGSTAWNNTVRSRIYLTRPGEEEEDQDPDIRIFKTMKANYGRVGEKLRLKWNNGAFVLVGQSGKIVSSQMALAELKRLVVNGTRDICQRGGIPSLLPSSPHFLAKMLVKMGLSEYRIGDIKRAIDECMKSGLLEEARFTRDRVARFAVRPSDYRFPEEQN